MTFMSLLMKIVQPLMKGLTSFDETFRKLTLNVVKGIIYLKMEIEMFTKIENLNFEYADLSCEVSVAPDGIGYDIYDTSTGNWVGSVDDLNEAQWFLQSIVDDFEDQMFG